MNSSQSQPHGEVPELFPQDTWEDAGPLAKDTQGAATILPPRRPLQEIAEAPASPRDHEGLRIGTGSHIRVSNDADDRLHVREIDGNVVRLEPEEPIQPKMPRHVVFHEQPAEQPRESESPAWGESTKFSPKWVAGISFGIVVLVIASLALLPLINRSNAANSLREPSAPSVEPETIATGPAPFDDLISRPDEAMRIFKEFVTTPDVENFLPMVRDRNAVEPLIRSSRHVVVVSRHWSPKDNAEWEIHQNGDLCFAVLKTRMPDFSDFQAYFVMADQQLLLDWKATTGYGTATFDELARNQGNPAEIRGLLRPSGHYSPTFPEATFQSFLLEGPDAEAMIWCYTRRDDPVDETLKTMFTGGDILKPSLEPHKVTLRLEHAPEDALPNQWLIGDLLHKDWISP